MNRVFVSCLLASAAATGCVADSGDESYVILNNLAPEIDEETMIATFTPSEDGPFVSTATSTTDFSLVEVGSMVESRIDAPEGKESLRTIFIMGGNIEAEVSDITEIAADGSVRRVGAAEIIQYQLPFSGSVRPNRSLSAVVYPLIPPEIMATVASKFASNGITFDGRSFITINTTITMFGDYYGERLDSQPFHFPVTIFAGGGIPESP